MITSLPAQVNPSIQRLVDPGCWAQPLRMFAVERLGFEATNTVLSINRPSIKSILSWLFNALCMCYFDDIYNIYHNIIKAIFNRNAYLYMMLYTIYIIYIYIWYIDIGDKYCSLWLLAVCSLSLSAMYCIAIYLCHRYHTATGNVHSSNVAIHHAFLH